MFEQKTTFANIEKLKWLYIYAWVFDTPRLGWEGREGVKLDLGLL